MAKLPLWLNAEPVPYGEVNWPGVAKYIRENKNNPIELPSWLWPWIADKVESKKQPQKRRSDPRLPGRNQYIFEKYEEMVLANQEINIPVVALALCKELKKILETEEIYLSIERIGQIVKEQAKLDEEMSKIDIK